MALSESSRNALIPSFLYAAPAAASPFAAAAAASVGGRTVAAPSAAAVAARPAIWARAPSEPGRGIEMYSPAFYAACTAGGVASCGLTHMTVTPLDLVKCNMQVSFSMPDLDRSVIYARHPISIGRTIRDVVSIFRVIRRLIDASTSYSNQATICYHTFCNAL